jgi:flagellar biosynthesis component FlhA
VEGCLSVPLKVLGWLMLVMATVMLLTGDLPAGSAIPAMVIAALMIWVGRWISAARTARVQRKWERHDEKVARIRRGDY